jgi:hypothetical protein
MFAAVSSIQLAMASLIIEISGCLNIYSWVKEKEAKQNNKAKQNNNKQEQEKD